MTKKIVLLIILGLTIFMCYMVISGNQNILSKNVVSIGKLEESSEKLGINIARLEQKNDDEFTVKKEKLKQTIEEYQKVKQSYETVIEKYDLSDVEKIIYDTTEVYDIGFLWTILGNYATEEKINLNFEVSENSNVSLTANNDYVICDLKFDITGEYVDLTNYIYDLENDDRLKFEISDFCMQESGEKIRVTLNIMGIKVKSDNLLSSLLTKQENESQESNTVVKNSVSLN